MGIFLLQSFLKDECENGFEVVNLKEIAKRYRETERKDPVLLVDLSSCASSFAQFGLSQAPETNLKVNLEMFINNCHEMGIKLIFVGDGMKPPRKFKEWRDRSVKRFNSSKMTEISMNQRRIYASFINFHIGNFHDFCCTLVRLNDKCKYVRAIYEADTYIIKYIKMHGCFAVLTKDSDFILADGAHYCLSIVDLEVKKMVTRNFNRNNLAIHFGIRPSDLPLFGIVVAHQDHLEKFTSKKDGGPAAVFQKFKKVAEAIKAETPFALLENHDSKNCLVCKDKREFYNGSTNEDLIQYSDENWNKIITLAKERHAAGLSSKELLEILLLHAYFCPPKFPRVQSESRVFWLSPLRERICGIIFREFPYKRSKSFVKEHTFILHHSTKKVIHSVRRIEINRPFPEFSTYPGLLKLWSKDCSKEITLTRVEVFCRALNRNLTPMVLQEADIPEDILFGVLALFYLKWEVKMEDCRGFKSFDESDLELFLTTIIHTNKLKRDGKEPLSAPYDEKALLKSEGFLLTVQHLLLLNSVCGEPYSVSEVQWTNYFDPKVYQWVYKELPHNEDVKEEVGNLKKKLQKIACACGHPDLNCNSDFATRVAAAFRQAFVTSLSRDNF